MPETINLKGEFDQRIQRSYDSLKHLRHRLELEGAKPTNWTKKQVDYLDDIFNTINALHQAVERLAAQARDD